MFSRKKPASSGKSKERGDLSQYGLFNVDNDFGIGNDDNHDDSGSGNDSDLEAELAAITAGGGPKRKPKPKLIPAANLDKMVADSLRDIGSDEELSDGDEDDPNLLHELSAITGEPEAEVEEEEEKSVEAEPPQPPGEDQLQIVKTRLEMYRTAESNAKLAGDSMKARRFNRGFKTLQDMVRKLEAGRAIDASEIPPEVSVKPIAPKPETNDALEPTSSGVSRPAPPIPASSETEKLIEPIVPAEVENPAIAFLKARQTEYKTNALIHKRSGDNATAIKFIKVAKMFDPVIKAVEEGHEVDMSNMPPPAAEYDYNATDEAPAPPAAAATITEPTRAPAKEENEVQSSNEAQEAPGLMIASTIGEALQQRLAKYKEVEQAAKDEGNSSKARRLGRIVKQFEDAIKLHKLGRPVPLEELPCPPGFGPFPTGDAPAVPNQAPVASPDDDSPPVPPPRPKLQKQDSRVSGNHANTHVMQVQIAELQRRQREFKLAALNAKKAGDIDQARDFLKIFKQFDALIDTAQGGFPVDMATLPIPPSARSNLEDSFTFINDKDCAIDGEGDVAMRLEEQLQKQLGMCRTTRDHLRAMGDVSGTNRFENLALSVQKDLDFLRLSQKKNLQIPKFHYEMRNFNIVKCNTDLTDNQVDVCVLRGISYNVPNPKDVDTYVRVDFPFPPDEPIKNKTVTIKNTDNPEYNESFLIEIQPKNRQCQRVFKRGQVKFEVYSKGGFLRSDVLIGTVLVKLQPLETVVEIHDSFELMDGRKKVGGKLEVKIRIRNPILTKQIEQVNEKWLIIDH